MTASMLVFDLPAHTTTNGNALAGQCGYVENYQRVFNMKTKKKPTSPKILSQEELLKWWPFERVDGKLLERRHKQLLKQEPKPQLEPAPF